MKSVQRKNITVRRQFMNEKKLLKNQQDNIFEHIFCYPISHFSKGFDTCETILDSLLTILSTRICQRHTKKKKTLPTLKPIHSDFNITLVLFMFIYKSLWVYEFLITFI